MPKHNEDFSNAEQEEKNKFHGGQDLVPGALVTHLRLHLFHFSSNCRNLGVSLSRFI